MRKILILIVLSAAFFLYFQKAYAEDLIVLTPTSTSTPSSTINYTLPYPGILPDNPLYVVKALRDKIKSFFISDPLKKAEFDLLISDVRLNAAQYLFTKGSIKYSLAETTISKAENYFFDALKMVNVAKQEGMPVNDFVEKLAVSSQKHYQVIKELRQKTSGEIKDRMAQDQERAKQYQEEAMQLKPK